MTTLRRPCITLVFLVLTFLFSFSAFAAAPDETRVLILPFEINASEDLAYLEESLPELVAERLAEKEYLVISPAESRALLQQQGITELNLQAVRDLAVLASASYAVYGSFTQLGEDISVDARLVEAFGVEPAKPIFVSNNGLINILPAIDEFVAKVHNEMMRKSAIAKVEVAGTKVLDPAVVTMRMRIRKGDTLDPMAVNEEVKRIFAMGYFSDVSVEAEQLRDGIGLTFNVTEKPRIERVVIEGSDEVDEDDILAAMSSKTGSVLNEKLLAGDLQKVEELYRKEGYYLAKVTHRIERNGHSANLILQVKEGEKLYIKEVVIQGVEQLDADDVIDELALSPRNILSWFTGTGVLREDYLERDSAAIGAYYMNRGFLDVKVGTPVVDYQEDGILVTFKVQEGQRYKVRNITFHGELIETNERLFDVISLDEWKDDEEYVSYTVLQKDVSALSAFYGKYGYAYADVNFRTARDGEFVDLGYTIRKKSKVYVRRVTVEGNHRTRDNVIRREMHLADGDRFDGEKLQLSNRALNGLGYFKAAEVEVIPTESPDEVDLKVKVAEQNTGSLMAGVGFSTSDGVGISGSIAEKNLWGKGYNASVSATFAGNNHEYRVNFWNPRIYDSRFAGGFTSYLSRDEFNSYTKDTIGGKVAIGYPIGLWTRVNAGYRLDNYKIFDLDDDASPSLAEQSGTRWASVVNVGIHRSTVDSIQRPSKGHVVSATAQYGGNVLMGDDEFIKVVGESRIYHALHKDHVLMARVKAGVLLENGSEDVPVVERFRLGGINSVRGYRREDFDITTGRSNDEIGGVEMAFANLEYQWYFNNEYGMAIVPFLDAGVNRDDELDKREIDNGGLLVSTGLE